MGQQQRIVHFEGQVQGVGFRYAAIRVARAHRVTGYVRNLDDGRVECVVEGEAGEIDRFIEQLTARMKPYIRRQTQQQAPYSGAFDGFDVRY